jgi:aryl-alcohol dehydrogenase-like predicted oxidoreductase
MPAMEYRDLGRTGVKVSSICLGTMMFGARAPEAESIAMIEHALEAGVNFIDTANVYGGGESERITGTALAKDNRRERVVLATKVRFPTSRDDPNAGGINRRHILRACEDSLRRLQTDWIDLYQLHRPQPHVPIDETLRALDDLIRDGKVRYIGTSQFPGWQIVESLWAAKEHGLNRFVCEQPAYNLLDRTAEREAIPAAQTFGLGVIPWSPLSGGLLTGKYKRGALDVEGRWSGGTDIAGRTVKDAVFDVVEGVAQVAADKGCSTAQLALAWCASQPGITAPIVGPRTLEQLIDNLGAAELTVSDEDRARLDAVAPPRSVTQSYYDGGMGVDFSPRLHRW